MWIWFWVIFVSYVDLILSYICVICGSVFELYLCHMWICFWVIFVSYVDLFFSYICVICGSVFELYLCHMWICFWVIFVWYVDLFLCYICVICGSVFELYLCLGWSVFLISRKEVTYVLGMIMYPISFINGLPRKCPTSAMTSVVIKNVLWFVLSLFKEGVQFCSNIKDQRRTSIKQKREEKRKENRWNISSFE